MDREHYLNEFSRLLDDMEKDQQDTITEAFIGEFNSKDAARAAKKFDELFGESAPYILMYLLNQYVRKGDICISISTFKGPEWDIETKILKAPKDNPEYGDGNTFRFKGRFPGFKCIEVEIAPLSEAWCSFGAKPEFMEHEPNLKPSQENPPSVTGEP